MQIEIIATNGERCLKEIHQFRIGVDSTQSTGFSASRHTFVENLTDALIDHALAKRPGQPAFGLYIQVWCGPGFEWRNIQEPRNGNVLGVRTPVCAKVADDLFRWGCNAVQMCRDITVMASGLAREAVEDSQ